MVEKVGERGGLRPVARRAAAAAEAGCANPALPCRSGRLYDAPAVLMLTPARRLSPVTVVVVVVVMVARSTLALP